MRADYDLTKEDLRRGYDVLTAPSERRLRLYPYWIGAMWVCHAGMAVLVFLVLHAFHRTGRSVPPDLRGVVAVWLCALVGGVWITKDRDALRRPVLDWLSRRAVARNGFGPRTLTADDTGLVLSSGGERLAVSWAEVRRARRDAGMLALATKKWRIFVPLDKLAEPQRAELCALVDRHAP